MPDDSVKIAPDGKFQKAEHILKSRDFRAVYRNARPVKRSGVVFYSLPNGLCHNRIGFSISSSVIKKATSRNRLRRLLREAYRTGKKRMRQGFDLVVVVRKDPGMKITYEWADVLLRSFAEEAGIADEQVSRLGNSDIS